MNDPLLHPRPQASHRRTRRAQRRQLVVVAAAATLLGGAIALVTSGGAGDDQIAVSDGARAGALVGAAPLAPATTAAPTTTLDLAVAAAADQSSDVPDLEGSPTGETGCLMTVQTLRQGESGESVTCLQEALIAAGFLAGPATGTFDGATFAAVETMQRDRDLFVDGVVGRESAISLGIWPDEASFIVRTPKPPEGAVDLMGYPLSSVASAGDQAPPLPPNSGSGRRLVYERAGQRVWAVDDDGTIVRSWLVSGSKYSNELPGTHQVYSKSEVSTAWNGKAYLPKMVRWLKTDIGAIGFHSIPLHVEDKSPYQTEDELGARLSGGCQRQAPRDADFLWDFADIGTKVVVL
jgi:peptidoglycan hydrolase-like protein with peptidoglycan-binding domain